MSISRLLVVAGVAAATAMPATAAVTASATTDLNLRAGPGPEFRIVDVIAGADSVDVISCIESTEWCRVFYDGTEGWAYSAYLTTTGETSVVIYQNAPELEIETVTYRDEASKGEVLGGATVGATLGALAVGGPVAAATGAIIGVAAADDVDEKTVTYVRSNPVEPVYLDGEVVVGAGMPDIVRVYEVPETTYRYAYVNGQPVLIEPQSRRIVFVVRDATGQ